MADKLVSSFYQLPAKNKMKRKFKKSPITEILHTYPLKYNLDTVKPTWSLTKR